MRDWQTYVQELAGTDLWAFALLDWYYKQEGPSDPASFIDTALDDLRGHVPDVRTLHRSLLALCLQLFGDDFDETTNRTVALLQLAGPLADEEMRAILKDYEDIGQADRLRKRLEPLGMAVPHSVAALPVGGATTTGGGRAVIGRVRLFYSYAHKDEKLRKKLEEHLSSLKRRELIAEWHDRNINAGEGWKQEIDRHLEEADIVLLLVSAHFINSEYCYSIELKAALDRHTRGECRVIPVILRDVASWSELPFGGLQGLPTDGRAVTGKTWKNQDEAFADVAAGLERVVKSLRAGGRLRV